MLTSPCVQRNANIKHVRIQCRGDFHGGHDDRCCQLSNGSEVEFEVEPVTQAHALLHADETTSLRDADYHGAAKRPDNAGKSVIWQVATRRSKRKALPHNKLGRKHEKLGYLKASVRAKVEYPFHVIKNLFRHRKTRYRGLVKNIAQLLFTLFAFAKFSAGRQAFYDH